MHSKFEIDNSFWDMLNEKGIEMKRWLCVLMVAAISCTVTACALSSDNNAVADYLSQNSIKSESQNEKEGLEVKHRSGDENSTEKNTALLAIPALEDNNYKETLDQVFQNVEDIKQMLKSISDENKTTENSTYGNTVSNSKVDIIEKQIIMLEQSANDIKNSISILETQLSSMGNSKTEKSYYSSGGTTINNYTDNSQISAALAENTLRVSEAIIGLQDVKNVVEILATNSNALFDTATESEHNRSVQKIDDRINELEMSLWNISILLNGLDLKLSQISDMQNEIAKNIQNKTSDENKETEPETELESESLHEDTQIDFTEVFIGDIIEIEEAEIGKPYCYKVCLYSEGLQYQIIEAPASLEISFFSNKELTISEDIFDNHTSMNKDGWLYFVIASHETEPISIEISSYDSD